MRLGDAVPGQRDAGAQLVATDSRGFVGVECADAPAIEDSQRIHPARCAHTALEDEIIVLPGDSRWGKLLAAPRKLEVQLAVEDDIGADAAFVESRQQQLFFGANVCDEQGDAHDGYSPQSSSTSGASSSASGFQAHDFQLAATFCAGEQLVFHRVCRDNRLRHHIRAERRRSMLLLVVSLQQKTRQMGGYAVVILRQRKVAQT